MFTVGNYQQFSGQFQDMTLSESAQWNKVRMALWVFLWNVPVSADYSSQRPHRFNYDNCHVDHGVPSSQIYFQHHQNHAFYIPFHVLP